MLNSIAVSALSEYVAEVKAQPEEGIAQYGVELNWESGTRSRVTTLPAQIGPHVVSRDFSWIIDEPRQLLGTNQAPNPQEYLLSGLGACITVGFTVGASIMGIALEHFNIKVRGELDLAGFLDARANAPIGFSAIQFDVEVAGNGTSEQFRELLDKAIAHSPNAQTLSRGTSLTGNLIIQS